MEISDYAITLLRGNLLSLMYMCGDLAGFESFGLVFEFVTVSPSDVVDEEIDPLVDMILTRKFLTGVTILFGGLDDDEESGGDQEILPKMG